MGDTLTTLRGTGVVGEKGGSPEVFTADVIPGGVSRTSISLGASSGFARRRGIGSVEVVGSLVSRHDRTGTKATSTRSEISCLTSVLKVRASGTVGYVRGVENVNLLGGRSSVATCLQGGGSSVLRSFTGIRGLLVQCLAGSGRVGRKGNERAVSVGSFGRCTVRGKFGGSNLGRVGAMLFI